MTEELMRLTPRELKKLHEGVAILKKAYGLTDADIDCTLKYIHQFGSLFAIVKRQQSEIEALATAVERQTDEETRKKIQEAEEELTREPSFIDLNND